MILLPGSTSRDAGRHHFGRSGDRHYQPQDHRCARDPLPDAQPGEFVDFGGLFGSGVVTQPASPEGAEKPSSIAAARFPRLFTA